MPQVAQKMGRLGHETTSLEPRFLPGFFTFGLSRTTNHSLMCSGKGLIRGAT